MYIIKNMATINNAKNTLHNRNSRLERTANERSPAGDPLEPWETQSRNSRSHWFKDPLTPVLCRDNSRHKIITPAPSKPRTQPVKPPIKLKSQSFSCQLSSHPHNNSLPMKSSNRYDQSLQKDWRFARSINLIAKEERSEKAFLTLLPHFEKAISTRSVHSLGLSNRLTSIAKKKRVPKHPDCWNPEDTSQPRCQSRISFLITDSRSGLNRTYKKVLKNPSLLYHKMLRMLRQRESQLSPSSNE